MLQSILHGHLSPLNKTLLWLLGEISCAHDSLSSEGMTYTILKPIFAQNISPHDMQCYVQYLSGQINHENMAIFLHTHSKKFSQKTKIDLMRDPEKASLIWPDLENMSLEKRCKAYAILHAIENRLRDFIEQVRTLASSKDDPIEMYQRL